MIKQSTVFVLGAGASAPYGFPLGAALARKICRDVEKTTTPLRPRLLELYDSKLVTSLPTEFRRSGQYSIDAFVERRKEFSDIAKAAIVQILSPFEIEDVLLDPPKRDEFDRPNAAAADRDWYRYLCSKIITSRPEFFSANKLRIITFNFDRSFERRLFVALTANYNLSPSDTESLTETIPVLHLHGDLGEPQWLPSKKGGALREYAPTELSVTELEILAKRLSLISDDIPTDRCQLAQQWLQQAQVVCFLGFGYHPLNLNRLNVSAIQQATVRGTARGMSQGELDSTIAQFHDRVRGYLFHRDLAKLDALQFLRETQFVHE